MTAGAVSAVECTDGTVGPVHAYTVGADATLTATEAGTGAGARTTAAVSYSIDTFWMFAPMFQLVHVATSTTSSSTSTSTTGPPSATSTSGASSPTGSTGLSTGARAGIGIGSALVGLLLLAGIAGLVVIVMWRRRQRRRQRLEAEKTQPPAPPWPAYTPLVAEAPGDATRYELA